MQSTLQISQSAVQYRRTVRRPIKTCPRIALRVPVILRGTCIVLRNILLIFRQHIHPKSFLGMKVRMSTRPMVYTNQYQRRIERNRCKGIGGHALYLAFEVHRDDGYAGRKTSQSLAEFC